jgi:hypothetical protein
VEDANLTENNHKSTFFYNELVYALKLFGTTSRLSRYILPQLALVFSSGLFSDEVST